MLSRNNTLLDKTSTPKRRRLGTGRILRLKLPVLVGENVVTSPNSRCSSPLEKNVELDDDPPLPCNQIEYFCDSGNTSSTSSDIRCSPGILQDSVMRNPSNWESPVVSRDDHNPPSIGKDLEGVEDISEEMFRSKLEQEFSQFREDHTSESSEKRFLANIEESFNSINQSIVKETDKTNRSSLFETKDSFLLDIMESGIFVDEKECKNNQDKMIEPQPHYHIDNNNNTFYGLPMVTKELFKAYRNIEKFYDWQEECLSLPAIEQHSNLIYALPTSGGKTLVAEVLMLREVHNRRKNVLFVLPFVAIVQEKLWSLSPFAVKLDFLVEEYTGGKGHIPPKKRRKKNSIYIATIEKGLAVVRSLIELGRLDEIGLIVVDELHLLGESGRGATLEILLTTVMFANQSIQIVGMSATIGNLPEVARFLRATVYERDFRPVQLTEYVKREQWLYRLVWGDRGALQILPHRELLCHYSEAERAIDPEGIGALVREAAGPVLVFCPTKRNCENVALLLARVLREDPSVDWSARAAVCRSLRAESAPGSLLAACARGVGYHHAGLSGDERAIVEHAYRSGVLAVLCCTMTLAAGVNLPAARVVIRAARVGRAELGLAAYRQMAGRAGRKGLSDCGSSVLMCSAREWPSVQRLLRAGLGPVRSVLKAGGTGAGAGGTGAGAGGTGAGAGGTSAGAGGTGAGALGALVLSAVGLDLAVCRQRLAQLLGTTLLAVTGYDDGSPINPDQLCDVTIQSLIQNGVLEKTAAARDSAPDSGGTLAVSALGRAAIKGCMDISVAQQLWSDLETAGRGLVLGNGLHLLYLVTGTGTTAEGIHPDYRHYYELYCRLDATSLHTARVLGITEGNAIRMITGKPITNVSERVLRRFYAALMLFDLWNGMPCAQVADKYVVSRGSVQSLLQSAASFAAGAAKFAEALDLWSFASLFGALAPRLHCCAAPELAALMELPSVKKGRAMQLSRAGYKRVEDLAKASADDLAAKVEHLSWSAACHLISAARMSLIEKVENLRAEAEDVMEELHG